MPQPQRRARASASSGAGRIPARLDPTKLGRLLTADEHLELRARTMLERDLEEAVRRLALSTGWLRYHTLRPKGSPAGFPDDVLLRDGRLIFAELKREGERPSEEQTRWLHGLEAVAAALEVYVWRPRDLLDGTIARILAR